MTTKLHDVHEVEIRRVGAAKQCADVNVVDGGPIAAAHAVLPLLREILQGREQESFIILIAGADGRVRAWREVARGAASHVQVPVRELWRSALLCDARAVILAHNHPSGDPTPSEADLSMTMRLGLAGEAVGCPVIDHVIIGEGERHFSFACNGEIRQGTLRVGVDVRARRRGPDLDE